jgi:hypothetical protein
MTLDRHQRPAVMRRQDVALDGGLKLVVMSNNSPVRIAGSVEERLWNRLARRPDPHRPVINRVADT